MEERSTDYNGVAYVISSVADPDPVGSGLFGSPGSGKIPDPDPLTTKRPL